MASASLASAQGQRGAQPVAERPREVRAAFVQRTYCHLLGALLCVTALECALFGTGLAQPIARSLLSASWLAVVGGLLLLSWIAGRAARAAEAPAVQYAALAAYVLAASLLLLPLLLLAQWAGFRVWTLVAGAIVALVGGGILHDTASVLRRYPEHRYVAAALELLASAVLLAWHPLRLFVPPEDQPGLGRAA